MIRSLTATEVKARILGLLDDGDAGETIEVTKHGRTVARLVPAHGPSALRGLLQGAAATADGDEDGLFSTDADWESR